MSSTRCGCEHVRFYYRNRGCRMYNIEAASRAPGSIAKAVVSRKTASVYYTSSEYPCQSVHCTKAAETLWVSVGDRFVRVASVSSLTLSANNCTAAIAVETATSTSAATGSL